MTNSPADFAIGGHIGWLLTVGRMSFFENRTLGLAITSNRHKILDAVGDLMLAGAPIAGVYEARQPGHALNNKLVRALLMPGLKFTYYLLPGAPVLLLVVPLHACVVRSVKWSLT